MKRYKKNFEHSYTIGVYPTLELLQHQRKLALGVVVHPAGVDNAGVAKIREICQRHQIPIEIQEKALSRIGARENDYAAGVFHKTDKTLSSTTNHVVLVNPSGMGNLGTIIRTMLGFNYLDLAIIQPAVDIFNPDVVRASMGALFQLRIERFPDIDTYLTSYPRDFYSMMTDGDISLPDLTPQTPHGLIFGNESAGLPGKYKQFGQSVNIPQNQQIDSLNLAIAVGVTLYQATLK